LGWKLAEKWGTNIVLANSINIKYDYYKTRKACTRNQDKLFDDIFGPENQSLKLMTMLYGQVWEINNW
jgi:hypothetical protein